MKEKVKAKITETMNYEKFGCPKKYGDFYYYFYNPGLLNQHVYYQKVMTQHVVYPYSWLFRIVWMVKLAFSSMQINFLKMEQVLLVPRFGMNKGQFLLIKSLIKDLTGVQLNSRKLTELIYLMR